MKNYFLLFVIILTVLVACNPNDDDTLPPNPPNPTNLPSWSSVGEIYGIGGSVIRCSEVTMENYMLVVLLMLLTELLQKT